MKSKLILLALIIVIAGAFAVYTAAQSTAPGARAQAPGGVPAGMGADSTGKPAEADRPLAGLAKEVRISRAMPERAKECIECHSKEMPGRVRDWSRSVMGRAGITCIDCHQAALTDKDARDCPGTKKYADLMISPVVTPADCGRCHPREQEQFAVSKHARTYEIMTVQLKDAFLRGMTSEVERAVGCFACHGTDIRSGELNAMNWPNEGCGRLNPDGSLGSCVICHTSHRFNIAEARKPETCGQCHLGPDHPQDEIYFESKHGKRYLAENDDWKFDAAPDTWEPGADFSSPTCAACHMSGIGSLATSHDVGERLKWESQLPLAVLNLDHDGGEARKKMIDACTQCHAPSWSTLYLDRYDTAINHYNDEYFKPAKAVMDRLYEKKILTVWPVFDEEIEWVFYELWHHEGRRARMGAMMMGPDFAWWHGFYEMKRHYQELMRLAAEAEERGHGEPMYVPGTGGANLTPMNVAPLPEGWKDVPHLKGQPE